MKIYSITNYNEQNVYKKNIAFKNYTETLSKAVKTEIRDTGAAEKLFDTLIREVSKEDFVQKSPLFYEIEEIYRTRGFMGLLGEIRQPKQDSLIQKKLEESEYDFVQVITQYGQSLFELFNFGKFGSTKQAPNDIRVIFSTQNQKENIEFNLGKKLNLNIGQNDGYRSLNTEFYVTTGTPKTIVENRFGSQTRTFYNEDGSMPFFKNWLFGGTATPIG